MKRCGIALVLPSILIGLLITPGLARAEEFVIGHAMQPGESLLDIELFYGLTAQEVEASNGELPPGIGAGDEVKIPVPFANSEEPNPTEATSYVVQRGDTLFRIATQFGIDINLLAAANQIVWFDRIYVGQILTIPGEGYVAPKIDPLAGTDTAVPPESVPQPTKLDGKQIIVVLSQQQTYAFENGVLLRHFVVSTGLPRTPTVVGEFQIYAKYDAQRMTGPGYDLPGVPWVMYFYQGYALHGTYWHNNFGHPMSHGCVNLRTPEAEWLYQWAPIGTSVKVIR